MTGDKPITRAWKLYEEGRSYNNRLTPNQYKLVDTNIAFTTGNQWVNLPDNAAMAQLPKPVFNIIKRVVSLFVASMTSSATKINFEPLTFVDMDDIQDDNLEIADIANAEIQNLWEKFKMDFRIRDALFDGAITGDYCMHFYWDPNKKPYGGAFGAYEGEICAEMVDGINVMFGNPNNSNPETQPYILVIGRDTVDHLQAEADYYKKQKGSVVAQVQMDNENQDQAGEGGKIELQGADNGKALFIYLYEKREKEVEKLDVNGKPVMELVTDKDGAPVPETVDGKPLLNSMGEPIYKRAAVREKVTTVHVTKCTRNVTIFENIDTGLTHYPLAWGNWERQRNQYHGRALVTGIIPNQIYINSMFAMVMRHQQLLGFPKVLYNGNYISQWTNEIGQAIAVRNLPDMVPMNQVATSIHPADMSNQIMAAIDKAMQYTKECLGATDAQLGNMRADNTSALIALQSASIVPLENPRACLYEWVEDIGRILLDMMGTYYGERPIVQEILQDVPSGVIGQDGTPMMTKQRAKVAKTFDFSKLKHLWLNVRADVGASTYWSRIAMVQTLDNLKRDGTLDMIQYLERMPAEYIPDKESLITEIKAKLAAIPAGTQLGEQEMGPGGGAGQGLGAAALISTMAPEQQAKFHEMPTVAKKAMMTQAKLNTNPT